MTLKCVESINLSLRENANKNKVQIIILPTSQSQIILESIVCEWLIIQFTLFYWWFIHQIILFNHFRWLFQKLIKIHYIFLDDTKKLVFIFVKYKWNFFYSLHLNWYFIQKSIFFGSPYLLTCITFNLNHWVLNVFPFLKQTRQHYIMVNMMN